MDSISSSRTFIHITVFEEEGLKVKVIMLIIDIIWFDNCYNIDHNPLL